MEVNADFAKRASAHAEQLPWIPSPLPGVDRRMLDRLGDEVARATTIVRYAPGSQFKPHVHGGGEEFLVLDGVFQDEHGDYGPGSYVRNPPTSKHQPSAAIGCVLFIKLWQMDLDDRTQVRLWDVLNKPFEPAAGRLGVETSLLHEDAREIVRLERWAAGAHVSLSEVNGGGIEVFVVDGSFESEGEQFVKHSWLRLPMGAPLAANVTSPCTVYVKTGHLRHVMRPTSS